MFGVSEFWFLFMRKGLRWTLYVGCNFTIVCLWLFLTRSGGIQHGRVASLYLILMVALLALIVLPLLLWGPHKPRWLLLSCLAVVNLYWGISWIGAYVNNGVGETAYLEQRKLIMTAMLLSSAVVALLYWALSLLLTRMKIGK